MRSFMSRMLILTLLTAGTALGANVAGVNLADQITVNGQTLVLNGAGLRKKLFIKVYTGALYLPAKQKSADQILGADTPRQMVMSFVYDVEKDKISEAWSEGLTANSPNAAADVKANFQTLQSWMEDMKKGQRIVMTYVPGTGTTIEVNGKTKGTLAGKATADAILATWIGAKPGPGADFKKSVLGG
jgi:hypothetical protein